MELGANKKSVAMLAGLLVLLAFVVYSQFFRGDTVTVPDRPPLTRTAASGNSAPAEERPNRVTARPSSRGGRFRPRLGRTRSEDRPDPATAEAELRTGLLDRLRGIEEPVVDRDIFNFGRPKPPPAKAPTPQEVRQAQSKLDAAMRKTERVAAPRPAPRPAAPRGRPPNWKYYGLADSPQSASKRAFLLDGDEILVAAEGSVVQDRYQIARIGLDTVELTDLEAQQEFKIRREASR